MTRWKTTTVRHRMNGGALKAVIPHRRVVAPRPLARWDFDAATGPWSTVDGDLPLATVAGAPTRAVTPWGYGLTLDGSSALAIPAASIGRLNIGGRGGKAVTVAAWVKSTDTNAGFIAGAWQENNNDPRRQYGLFFDLPTYGGDDRVCFHVSRYGGATPGYPFSRDYSASPDTYANGVWNFMVGTYDGAQAISYLNGSAASYRGYTDPLGATYAKNPYAFPDGLNTVPVDFTVGACTLTSGLGNFAVATIARVRVWEQALTPQQVLELYRAEKPAY